MTPPDDASNASPRESSVGYRDAVFALTDPESYPPMVVSVSDVHGYWDAFASTLSLPGDLEEFPALVDRDEDGRLHWNGGEDGREYVLVCNGDMIDRGGDGERVVDAIRRLQREAPRGHVRYLLGNHEQFLLAGGGVGPDDWYCNRATVEDRRAFFDAIASGDVALAYDGYAYTYSHAGSVDGIDPARANDALQAVADETAAFPGTPEDTRDAFQRAFDDAWVTRAGTTEPKGPDGGPLWLGWEHLPGDAPRQVVGHTRHDRVTRRGNVVCTDVVRDTRDRPGGEAITVETPAGLHVLERTEDGTATRRSLGTH